MKLYDQIPPGILDGLDRYLMYGIRPGDFLSAVLENDLTRSFRFADDASLAGLFALVIYLTNEVPGGAWGSKSNVAAYLAFDQTQRDEWMRLSGHRRRMAERRA